jgi:hypothetical protein
MKTEIAKTNPPKTISMRQMEPCQMGWLKNRLVMRTADSNRFEVMDLSNMEANSCWDTKNDLQVTLITEPVTVTFIP